MGKTFVPVIVLMMLGVLLTSGLKRLEKWIAPWRRSEA
jgi:ABC-type nitrate/sulfonate/bicarbonate transport system permease component